MGLLISDQNKLCHFYESGTYANASGTGQWIGKVIEHQINQAENVMEARYLNVGTRDVDSFNTGTQDIDGVITYNPQDWKMLLFTLGSVVDGGSPSPYTHVITPTNSNVGNAYTSGTICPFVSFGLEDAQVQCGTGGNFIRTLKGCTVDSFKLSGVIGEPLKVELGYMAQSIAFSSGTATTSTDSGLRPFMFNDVSLQIVSGTTLQGMTDFSLTINNSLKRENFLNGSRVAFTFTPIDRNYELTATLEGEGLNTKSLYDQYYTGGSEFNVLLKIDASTGSRDAFFTFSGCRITSMDAPSKLSTVNEQSITIKPKTCTLSINDLTLKYGAW